ncbi:pheromone A receptor-domain-containing protein [Cytidiella melzeri]|nr:pheromone A receptor-domain-containing protein [Cytidiella melzeri]
MSDPTYPLFSVFAILGFVLGLVPLPWHLQAMNAGTCIYMLWASIASLIQFVNSLVWNGNINNVAPVWCDFATKFLVGAGVGIPASSLCINRRLYNIASVRAVSISHQDKRRAVFVDVAIGIGIPVLVMALHYIVQGHRFNIVEDIGCTPTTFWTPPAIPLVFMWPTLIGCVSFFYAALTLRAFWIRRAQFSEVLSSSASLTISRYFRLMLLSCLEMSCTIPVSVYSVYIITEGFTIAPWISWADTHYNFSFVEQVPAIAWRSNTHEMISMEMSRWVYPCASLLFFALFGFADEARRHYRKAFSWLKTRLCCILRINGRATPLSRNGFVKNTKAQPFPSEATIPLPAYSPRKIKRAESTFSSVISFTDFDLEKGLNSASFTSPTISSPSETVIGCSDLESPSSVSYIHTDPPPSPPPLVYEPRSSPPYRSPFSPPTFMPVTPTSATAAEPTTPDSSTALRVVIHRESCQEL